MKRLLSILSLLALIASSCLESDILPLNAFPPYGKKLVINAVATSGEALEIQVTNSVASTSSDFPELIEDAEISITRNNSPLTVNYNIGSKMYDVSGTPAADDVYNLDVRRSSYLTVSSVIQIPASINANAQLIPDGGYDTSGMLSDLLKVSFQDDGSGANYYKINFFYYNGTLAEFFPLNFVLNDPSFTELNSQRLNDGSVLFNDELFNGGEKTISVVPPFGTVVGNPAYKYLIQLESINEDLYKYYVSLQRAKDARDADFDNAFNSAVVIHSNINNGLGIFGASYMHKDTLN